MKSCTLLFAALGLASCSAPEGTSVGTMSTDTTGQAGAIAPLEHAKTFSLKDLPNLDENVRNDTLLVYTTHDLGNGEFVMAAKHADDKREGLRLILYRPRPDSSAEVLAVSKPAYDSEVMLPTYFSTGDTADGTVILANYGGLESWGQNVFWLKGHRFIDLGWLDVAYREWKTRMDSLQQWRGNIAPRTVVHGADDHFEFSFTGDSLQLYDDLQGGTEVMFPASRVKYRYDGDRMILVVDGMPCLPKDPA